tara:strand:+ start:101 stop:970 length:870 start_codon:yes stop_codon:yes gene_type:complete
MAKSKQNMKKNNNKTIKRYRRKVKNKRRQTKRKQTKRKQTTKKLLKGGEELLLTFQNIYKNIVVNKNKDYKCLKLQKNDEPPEWLYIVPVDGDILFIMHFDETRKTPTHIKLRDYGHDCIIPPNQNIENITTDEDYTCKNVKGDIMYNLKDYNVTIEDDKAILRTIKKIIDFYSFEEERLLITFQDILDDTEKYEYVRIGKRSWVKIKNNGERNLTFHFMARPSRDGKLRYLKKSSCQIPEDIGDKHECHDNEGNIIFNLIRLRDTVTNQDLRFEIDECVRRAEQTQGE